MNIHDFLAKKRKEIEQEVDAIQAESDQSSPFDVDNTMERQGRLVAAQRELILIDHVTENLQAGPGDPVAQAPNAPPLEARVEVLERQMRGVLHRAAHILKSASEPIPERSEDV